MSGKMKLITLAEYAKMHNVDPSTLRHKIKRKTLKAIKFGNTWVIDKNEPYIDYRKKPQ